MPIKKFDSAIQAMQAISEIGQQTINVPISEDFSITLSSLGAKDETDSFIDCMNYFGQAFLYKHKTETLVRSMISVNDLSLDEIELDVKRELIGRWSQSLVDKIYFEYAKLTGSVESFLEKIKLTAQTNIIGKREQDLKDEQEDSNKEKKDEA